MRALVLVIFVLLAGCGSAAPSADDHDCNDPVPEPRDECGVDDGNPCTNNVLQWGSCIVGEWQADGYHCQPCPGVEGHCDSGECLLGGAP